MNPWRAVPAVFPQACRQPSVRGWQRQARARRDESIEDEDQAAFLRLFASQEGEEKRFAEQEREMIDISDYCKEPKQIVRVDRYGPHVWWVVRDEAIRHN